MKHPHFPRKSSTELLFFCAFSWLNSLQRSSGAGAVDTFPGWGHSSRIQGYLWPIPRERSGLVLKENRQGQAEIFGRLCFLQIPEATKEESFFLRPLSHKYPKNMQGGEAGEIHPGNLFVKYLGVTQTSPWSPMFPELLSAAWLSNNQERQRGKFWLLA